MTKNFSDRNSPCCENCQFSEAGVKCREAQRSICEEESYCTGLEAGCPKSKPLPDGTECQERGQCLNGTCTPFCETQGLQSCMCDRGKQIDYKMKLDLFCSFQVKMLVNAAAD